MDTAPPAPAPALRDWSDLPGPRGWPLLGNLPQIDKLRMHASLESWAERYGPVYRLRLGPRRVTVIADPALSLALMRDRPDGFGRSTKLGEVMDELGFRGVFGANGDSWQAQRRMVAAAFDPRHIKDYFPHLVTVIGRYQRHWERLATSGECFDLGADLMRFTVDVVAGLAFGSDLNTIDANADQTIQSHIERIFPAMQRRVIAAFPIWRYWKCQEDRALEQDLAQVRSAIAALIATARQRLRDQPTLREMPANLLDAMLVAAEQADSRITDHDVASNVLTMLLAGEDTTANTLAWLVLLAHQSTTVMAQLRQEADAALGSGHWIVDLPQVDALAYTTACVHETLRLKPAAPFLVHEAMREVTVGDLRLPAGALVMTLTRAGSLQSQHFADPGAFRPERWLDPASRQVHSRQERFTLPFGSGPRICPGRGLALIECALVVSMLVHNFDIVELSSADDQPVRELMKFVMMPSRLRVRLRPRERSAGPPAPEAPA